MKDKLNLGCGKIVREGWHNVDKFAMPGVDQQIDLFRFPWDLPDNQFTEVFASHIIEHVPHESKPNTLLLDTYTNEKAYAANKARWAELESLDGFFAFFAEIWRVCKAGATIDIVCPFGYTPGAFQDPTHTRYIVPATFHYLQTEQNDNFDYHLPFKFHVESVGTNFEPVVFQALNVDETGARMPAGTMSDTLKWASEHEWAVCRDMYTKLTVVK